MEDRQYQLDIVGMMIYTCHWKDLKANSRELLPSPSSTMLKTMSENPALEWNTVRSDLLADEVVGHPILSSVDVGVAFAPAIVYEANAEKIERHIVVAGHSLEINATSEMYVYINLHQIACIQGILVDLNDMMEECFSGSSVESKEEILSFNYFKESDSGIDSIIASANDHLELGAKTSSEILQIVKEGRIQQTATQPAPVSIPFDLLVTASLLQIMTFDTKHRYTNEQEVKTKIVGIVPLVFSALGQPHLVLSINDTSQRAEISVFELLVGFASAEKRTTAAFVKCEMPFILFILWPSL